MHVAQRYRELTAMPYNYQGPIGLPGVYGSACCVTHIALLNQREITGLINKYD